MSTNRVISAGLAFVDGKKTGLAGCNKDKSDCPAHSRCLRTDPVLTAYRTNFFPVTNGHCSHFIKKGEA